MLNSSGAVRMRQMGWQGRAVRGRKGLGLGRPLGPWPLMSGEEPSCQKQRISSRTLDSPHFPSQDPSLIGEASRIPIQTPGSNPSWRCIF